MHIGFISNKYLTKYYKFDKAVHFCVCVCVCGGEWTYDTCI